MKRSLFAATLLLTGVLILAIASAAQAQIIVTDYLYVTYFGNDSLDRYSFKFNKVTNTIVKPILGSEFTPDGKNPGAATDAAVLISSGVVEGILGTSDDIIVVGAGHSSISRYDYNGTPLIGGTIPVFKYVNGTWVSYSLNGVGNIAITSDGKYLYAAEQGAGDVVKIDLSNGHIVDIGTLVDAHDIAIGSDGTVYATGLKTPNGVVAFSSNLSSFKTLIPMSDIVFPTGIALTKDSNGTTDGLYIDGDTTIDSLGGDTVYHFSLITATTGTLTQSVPIPALMISYGNDLGPDGNLYIGTISNTPGYTAGVYEYNTSSQQVSLAIAGVLNGTAGYGGLEKPKYLEFNTSFITAPDAGLVPEPGNVAMLAGLVLGGAAFLRRRRPR